VDGKREQVLFDFGSHIHPYNVDERTLDRVISSCSSGGAQVDENENMAPCGTGVFVSPDLHDWGELVECGTGGS